MPELQQETVNLLSLHYQGWKEWLQSLKGATLPPEARDWEMAFTV